jgi:hypothetical protein
VGGVGVGGGVGGVGVVPINASSCTSTQAKLSALSCTGIA